MYRLDTRKFVFSLLLVFCISVTAIFAQTATLSDCTMDSAHKSSYLFTLLKDKGFSPSRQSLVPFDDSCFPDNLLITIDATNDESAQEKNNSARTTVVFACTTMFASENTDNLFKFIQNIKDLHLPYTVIILLSADDESLFSDSASDYHPGGTTVFATSVQD